MSKFLVVIPFVSGPAQGKELELAIAGWEKHFKESYKPIVIGDYSPILDTYKNIEFIDCPRLNIVGNEYRPALDVVNKFRTIIRMYPEYEGCIWAADDIYAVNDFTIEDVLKLRMREPDLCFSHNSTNPWRRMMARTKDVLVKEGLPTINYSVHLPLWYDFSRLTYIFDKYLLDTVSLNFQILYFNTYNTDIDASQLIGVDTVKYGIYSGKFNRKEIEKALKSKIWINNSISGYSSRLEKILREHYGIK